LQTERGVVTVVKQGVRMREPESARQRALWLATLSVPTCIIVRLSRRGLVMLKATA
jgi:hypothetical protein